MANEFDQYKFPILHGEESYARMMIGLLPKGVIWGVENLQYALEWVDTIWSTDEKVDTIDSTEEIQDVIDGSWSGDTLGLLLSCFGSELSRIEGKAWEVLNGTDPGVTTGNYLTDWERNLGLPGPCVTGSQSLDERQRAAHSKLFDEFITTTEQAYIDYAASLGYTITVDQNPDEYQPRIMGVARMGVERLGDRGGYGVMEIVVTDGDGTMEFLECKMNKFKPAHALLIYTDDR